MCERIEHLGVLWEAACEPVLEVDNAVRFRVGVREGLIGVHLIPAGGELGKESGCCENEKNEGGNDREIVEGKKRFDVPRKRCCFDVGEECQPFFSKDKEQTQNKCVGSCPIEKSDHAGDVDDEHEDAEAEEKGENEALEEAGCFNPKSADEAASD